MSALSFVFAFVLMLGVLIFVHEFGHFIVAKMCGVKVLKFSLGFGPPIGIGRYRLQFRRGETEYVAAWFPLGGFVKMLGENPDEEDTPETLAEADRAFNHKPVWQRLAILFAGPGMNLLLPVVIFAVALAVGMPSPEPVIGTVERGSPAAAAGLAPDDRLLTVDGEPVAWWDDVEGAVRAAPGRTLALDVERGGERLAVELPVDARSGLDPFGNPTEIGWAGLGHARLSAVVGIPDATSPAAGTALRSGDRITAVDGEPVEDWVGFAARYAAGEGEVELAVERRLGTDPEAAPETDTVRVPAVGSVDALGVVPATALIAEVSPDSPADRGGLEAGDLIVAVEGEPVGSFASFAELVRSSEGRALAITYARTGERFDVEIAPELREADMGLGIPEERYLIGITARAAAVIGAVGVDQELNPLRSIPRAVAMTADITRTFLGGLKRLVTGEVSRKQVAGPIGIAEIAHNALQRGWFAYLSTLILISINLGILNLLPIPVLDGGQALLVSIEGIKRSPVSLRTREVAQQIGVTVLVMLMGLAFWNDLSRHWLRFIDWVKQSAGLS
ncbi:MAG: RIP metalloprotease RseP [Myxococcota bacterium]|nr:RIP metalloprotease RseP [Myxococcota bacterium]